MFFAESKYTNNVYYIDIENNAIELWDFQNDKMLWRQRRPPAELAEELYGMLKNGWVKRTSDELEACRMIEQTLEQQARDLCLKNGWAPTERMIKGVMSLIKTQQELKK